MAQTTSLPRQTNRIQWYVIVGLVCITSIGGFVIYQDMASKAQTPVVQNPPTPASSEQQPVQTTQPSSTPQEPSIATKPIDLTLLEHDIHEIANQERESRGVQSISYDPKLAEIASMHSQDMATHQFLSHSTYEGGHNLNYRYAFAGYDCKAKTGSYSYSTSNENIAVVINKGDEMQIAQHIVNTWFDNVADSGNILDSQHQTEGIGVALTGNKMAVYATEDFC